MTFEGEKKKEKGTEKSFASKICFFGFHEIINPRFAKRKKKPREERENG